MDALYARYQRLCLSLVIHFMRYSDSGFHSNLAHLLRVSLASLKRSKQSRGGWRITQNRRDSQVSSVAYRINSPPRHHPCSCVIKGLANSQSSFTWDECRVGNIVKDKKIKTPPVVNRMGNVENVTRRWPLQSSSSTGQRGRDRNQMRPDERRNKLKIYWRQQKMQETRTEWQGGGERGTYRDTSVFR